jgi:hypothetical protein
MSESYYSQYTIPAVYQTVATGGDQVVSISNNNVGLINFHAINVYNATVYAQVHGVPTGVLAAGAKPLAVLGVPTGVDSKFFDSSHGHWINCPTGLTIAASSTPAIYTPVGTGALCLTVVYKP